MITAATDSKILIWTVRPVPAAQAYVTIASFTNMSYNMIDEIPQTVRSFSVYYGEDIKGISRGNTLKQSQIDASVYREFKTGQVLAKDEQSIRVSKEGVYRGLTQIMEARLQILGKYNQIDEKTGISPIEKEFEEMRMKRNDKMVLLNQNYDVDVEDEGEHLYVYVGDDLGFIKLWEMGELMRVHDI